MVGHKYSGWYDSNANDINIALHDIYNNRDKARRRGVAASDYMSTWTWSRTATQFTNMIKQLGSGSSSSSARGST
jgi:hypothetical protein